MLRTSGLHPHDSKHMTTNRYEGEKKATMTQVHANCAFLSSFLATSWLFTSCWQFLFLPWRNFLPKVLWLILSGLNSPADLSLIMSPQEEITTKQGRASLDSISQGLERILSHKHDQRARKATRCLVRLKKVLWPLEAKMQPQVLHAGKSFKKKKKSVMSCSSM